MGVILMKIKRYRDPTTNLRIEMADIEGKFYFFALLYELFKITFFFPDMQFPIDVSGVQNDHPFLDADSLQSLFRRLTALNRCATMKLEHHHHQKRNVSVLYYCVVIS